ncbi:hypothetical protein BGZ83_004014 [Gryganskiella cystojenkinii]|nr:hypothetical protein BGZ83_004014 [Gryganskiella cystojenkinii]
MTKTDQDPTVDALAIQAPGQSIKTSTMTVIEGILVTTDPWTNWAKNLSCQPEQTFHPKTLTDLQTIVRLAHENNKKVRCAGTGHSWSAVSVTSDYLVSTKDMNRIHVPEREGNCWTVTIETGVTIDELDLYLRQQNPPLCLPSNVLVGEIRYGGILSLGCHGASRSSRTMSDMITKMEIVNGLGDLVTYSAHHGHDEFSAACVNLGLLGLIYTVTLKVESMQSHRLRVMDSCPRLSTIFGPNLFSQNMNMEQIREYQQSDLAIAAANLKRKVLEFDGIEFFYSSTVKDGSNRSKMKFNDHVWIKQWDRTQDPVTTEVEKSDDRERFLMSQYPEEQDRQLIMDHPFAASFFAGQQVQETPDAIHFAYGDGTPMTVMDVGVGFKVDEDFVNVVDAFAYLVTMCTAIASCAPDHPSPAIEVRFIHASTRMMAPAYDEDPNAIYCMINLIDGRAGFEQIAAEILDSMMMRYNAKPHWAKLWGLSPNVHHRLRVAYGKRLVRFNEIREKQDPTNMFVNDMFEKLFLLRD